MADKVMKPQNKTVQGGAFKQVKSSIIEGPTVTSENISPYNRKGSSGSKK